MVRLSLAAAAFVGALVLASCATLSEAECEAGDWRAIGISDGANGYPPSYIDNHIEACSEYGVAVDRQLYLQGREQGLERYCTLETAERDGRRGRRNYGTCEGEMAVSFLLVHRAARSVSEAEAKIDSVDAEIDGLFSRLSNRELSDAERTSIMLEIDSVRRTRFSLERALLDAERDLAEIRREEELRLARSSN